MKNYWIILAKTVLFDVQYSQYSSPVKLLRGSAMHKLMYKKIIGLDFQLNSASCRFFNSLNQFQEFIQVDIDLAKKQHTFKSR